MTSQAQNNYKQAQENYKVAEALFDATYDVSDELTELVEDVFGDMWDELQIAEEALINWTRDVIRKDGLYAPVIEIAYNSPNRGVINPQAGVASQPRRYFTRKDKHMTLNDIFKTINALADDPDKVRLWARRGMAELERKSPPPTRCECGRESVSDGDGKCRPCADGKYHTYLCACGTMYDAPYAMQFVTRCPVCDRSALGAKRIRWDDYKPSVDDAEYGAWLLSAASDDDDTLGFIFDRQDDDLPPAA
jgi:hypothetical protein